MSGGYFLFAGGSTVTARFFFRRCVKTFKKNPKWRGEDKPGLGWKSLLAQSQKDQVVKLVFDGRGTEVITMTTDLRLLTSCQPSS